mmetsp:Transcript_7926/g.10390  ORF Transcript_7926/g.10390 Transcript_7926/m.10390 type:complete len:203 (+) Transcript_7926:164-772(+)
MSEEANDTLSVDCGGDSECGDSIPELTVRASSSLKKKWVHDPLPTDIICGRGARVSHPGNQRFRTIVFQRKGEYQQVKRREDKTRITLNIVNILLGGSVPARFLLKDSETDQWYDVGIEYAKEKVSHALRSRPGAERRKRNKPKRLNQKMSCSPQLERTVNRLICDQQQLLEAMIRREVVLPLTNGAVGADAHEDIFSNALF